ncbi:MAG: response regulator transcription factor, partial [Chloroflexota bacterium]
MNEIRVMLADDHAIVRDGLKSLLSSQQDIAVVAEADNGRDAIEIAKSCHPDVIVMDFSMPGLNGLEGTLKIKNILPSVKIIVLTMHDNEEYILQFIRAGANSYLLKESIADQLIHAIRRVMTASEFFSPSLSEEEWEQLMHQHRSGNLRSPLESLTNRQREVLQLIAEGLTNKGIAKKLSISVKTVETHRAAIMSKLNIHDQAGLTR